MENKTDWRIERVLQGLLLAVVLAALVGLLGGYSTLSRVNASEGPLQVGVDYHKVSRNGMTESVVAHIRNSGGEDTADVEIRLTRSYLDGFNLEGISPEPESQATDDSDLVLKYSGIEAQESKVVHISLESEFPGRYPARLTVRTPDGEPVTAVFQTTVLP